jgi:threonine/homoserine/homoserine lactone efflux protein
LPYEPNDKNYCDFSAMKLLAAGFILSLLGSLPPGMISLTVARTTMLHGVRAALVMAGGAALAEFFQAIAAVWLSDWFLQHPEVALGFRWVAALVFTFLGVYLLGFAKAPKMVEAPTNARTTWRQFLKGVAISAINLLAIPYWFVYCGWLKLEGWWLPGYYATSIFAAGVALGTFFSLALYVWLGMLIVQRFQAVAVHANRLVGAIFIGLAAKLFWELYW